MNRLLQRLFTDTRGAVMVMGVVFAALMVGILWHMVGVGDAILYRERIQEASDATAFEAAVWHARTMNLLVVLNIIMSAILSVLVLWRLVELLLGVAGIVCAILALIPFMEWLEALSDAAFSMLERMATKDTQIYENVEKWLVRVNKAEKMVSTWAPLVDLGQPCLVNSGYYRGPSVNITFPLSTSLIPSIESYIPLRFPPRMNMSSVLSAMPIQEDGEWKLCQKAGQFVPLQISDFLKRLHLGAAGDAIGKIGSVFGNITGSFPGYFCGSLAEPSGVDKAISDAATTECDSEEAQYNQSNDGGKPSKPFDRKKCMDKAKQQAKAAKDRISNKPAKVWDVARNGGLFFQTWSFTEGTPHWSFNDDRGVELANGGSQATGLGDETDYHWSFAEGEYFYDGSGSWDSLSGEAMWNIQWKARLRRVHDPVRMFDAAGFATGWLVNGLNQKVTDIVKGAVPAGWDNWIKQSAFDTWWSNELFKKRILRNPIESVTYDKLHMDNLGNWVMDHIQGSSRTKMIH